jgi:hypothetical protein
MDAILDKEVDVTSDLSLIDPIFFVKRGQRNSICSSEFFHDSYLLVPFAPATYDRGLVKLNALKGVPSR